MSFTGLTSSMQVPMQQSNLLFGFATYPNSIGYRAYVVYEYNHHLLTCMNYSILHANWSQEPFSVNVITRVYASVPSIIHQTCSAFPIAGSIQITLRNQTVLTLDVSAKDAKSLISNRGCFSQRCEIIDKQSCIAYTDFVADEQLADRLHRGVKYTGIDLINE